MNTQGKNNGTPTALAILAAGAVFISPGCKSEEQPEVFNVADTLPSLPGNTVPSHQLDNLSKGDEMAVEEQVYSKLLTGHYWDDNSYSAIFLSTGDLEVQALQDKFPNRVP